LIALLPVDPVRMIVPKTLPVSYLQGIWQLGRRNVILVVFELADSSSNEGAVKLPEKKKQQHKTNKIIVKCKLTLARQTYQHRAGSRISETSLSRNKDTFTKFSKKKQKNR